MGIYTRKTIRTVRKKLDTKKSFLKDLFFPRKITVDSEEIMLETTLNGNKMAPFVSKIEDGRVMKETGIKTNIIEAPNIAPKHILGPKDVFKRDAGENVIGGTSPAIKMANKLGKILGKQEGYITNKEEAMAGEFLSTGMVTSNGSEHAYEINYELSNKGTLGPGLTWDEPTVNPLTDIDKFVVESEKFGEKVENIVMESAAADAFTNNSNTKEFLDNRRLDLIDFKVKDLGPGIAYLGFYKKRSVHLYQYDRVLNDKNGNTIKPIPVGTIVGGPNYGEILYAPIVYFKEDGADVYEEIRHSRNNVSQNGKEKSISTESRPVFQPSDMSGYFSWKVV